MSKINILLVDDQPGKLLSYQTILEDLGANLVLASSGREALHHLLRTDFALILLDVVMPEMDGFETAASIRQHPRLEHTPIIFLTSFSTSDFDRHRGYQLGAVDYVFAPVVREILRAKVSVFIELHRKREELYRANEQLRVEILERKKAQEQALKAERLAAIGEMVAGLAHESRNALQQIQASLEMLSRRPLDQLERELVDEIQKAQDRLLRLFEQVRTYAAPIRLELEMYNLSMLWRDTWKQVKSLVPERDAGVSERIDATTIESLIDPLALGQVFRNIFENSLAACRDPVDIQIQFTQTKLEDRPALRVLIRDNGPGLTAEQREKVFKPFYTTKVRGTGLGLAISKRIVEAHGGRMALGESPAPGMEIEIVLPGAKP